MGRWGYESSGTVGVESSGTVGVANLVGQWGWQPTM